MFNLIYTRNYFLFIMILNSILIEIQLKLFIINSNAELAQI